MLLAILLALVAIGVVQVDGRGVIRALAAALLVVALLLAVLAEVPV